MKNKGLYLLIALLTATVFTGCNKCDDEMVFNAQFYTPQANAKLMLYVDGNYLGELSYLAQEPVCGQEYSDGQRPLSMQLSSGTHSLTAKDENGHEVSVSTMRISRHEGYLGGRQGGSSIHQNGDCLIIGLWQ